MRPRLIHWERKNYSTNQFDLIELYETGEVVKRTFQKQVDDFVSYEESDRKVFNIKGHIRVDKIMFNEDHKLLNRNLVNNKQQIKTFDSTDWEDAQKYLRQLHNDTNDDLTTDFRLVFVVDQDSFTEETPLPKEIKEYQITFFRAVTTTQYIHRLKNPENLAIVFVPELNESLYFHYIPDNNHITLTGDNLFALSTKVVDHKLNEHDFYEIVNGMLDDIKNNIQYYHTLIVKQRDRRAMLETDVMGDLYPR
jgi:hypothetical protein